MKYVKELQGNKDRNTVWNQTINTLLWTEGLCASPDLYIEVLPQRGGTYDGTFGSNKGLGLVGKESACSAGDLGSIPGLGRFPGEGNGNPLQYPCLENLMERGGRWAAVYGVAKSRHD